MQTERLSRNRAEEKIYEGGTIDWNWFTLVSDHRMHIQSGSIYSIEWFPFRHQALVNLRKIELVIISQWIWNSELFELKQIEHQSRAHVLVLHQKDCWFPTQQCDVCVVAHRKCKQSDEEIFQSSSRAAIKSCIPAWRRAVWKVGSISSEGCSGIVSVPIGIESRSFLPSLLIFMARFCENCTSSSYAEIAGDSSLLSTACWSNDLEKLVCRFREIPQNKVLQRIRKDFIFISDFEIYKTILNFSHKRDFSIYAICSKFAGISVTSSMLFGRVQRISTNKRKQIDTHRPTKWSSQQ